jgi:hypothetical protein
MLDRKRLLAVVALAAVLVANSASALAAPKGTGQAHGGQGPNAHEGGKAPDGPRSQAGGQAAEHDGNNGTVKVHIGAGEPDPARRNQPRTCDFHLQAFGFDAGQDLAFTIESWPPTGDRTAVLSGTIELSAAGEGRSPASGVHHLADGHYRLTVDGDGVATRNKHKVFWVRCAPAKGVATGNEDEQGKNQDEDEQGKEHGRKDKSDQRGPKRHEAGSGRAAQQPDTPAVQAAGNALPFTGASVAALLLAGFGLAGLGAIVLAGVRRRHANR